MNGKPTYQQLCCMVGAGLMDMWKKGTDLTANEMSVLWNGYPLPKSTVIRALQEYNNLFDTTYTLDQVDIPTLIY